MAYHVRNYHKSTEQKAVEGLLKGLWWLISLPFRLIFGGKAGGGYRQIQAESLDKNYVYQKLQEIEELIKLGHPSNFSRAVLEGDKLLDHILKSLRTPGLTMGDRLRAARNRFSPETYSAAWQAHKIRNELVHNSQYEITDFMAREAVGNFKKAIGELVR